MALLLRWVVAVAAMAFVLRQCRKPFWFLGRRVARVMNVTHRELTSWGLSKVPVKEECTILDVGCGGGQTIATLADRASQGRVQGIDYSPASVAVARDLNRKLIDQGRVDIQVGSVSKLPFSADTFDLVTAVETHYYWPDLRKDFEEIRRVLRPGGALLIIAEAYRGRRMDWLYRPAMALLGAKYLTAEQHRQLLIDAGFKEVEVFVDPPRGWLAATGRKQV